MKASISPFPCRLSHQDASGRFRSSAALFALLLALLSVAPAGLRTAHAASGTAPDLSPNPAFGTSVVPAASPYLGPAFDANSRALRTEPRTLHEDGSPLGRLRAWNRIAIDASGLDHTPVLPGETRVFGEQIGPTRASRAMAIVHIAIFDAINAIDRRYQSYVPLLPATPGASTEAAIAQAAHDTLVALYPSQAPAFDRELRDHLAAIHSDRTRTLGIDIGKKVAAAILTLRQGDGSEKPDPRMGSEYVPGNKAGEWQQDPISLAPLAYGAYWGDVAPFVLASGSQFRVVAPPSLASSAYAAAFAEVKALGGDGIATPTTRTREQTETGIFWAYDGTPSLCAPPRLYNQIAVAIAEQMGSDVVDLARLLALVNTAMADAGIAVWESKYYYELWRPVTAMRAASSTAPTKAEKALLENFTPLGAPASNLTGPNFTPPFPSYPSGHAGFGGALFQILRRFYGRDDIAFTFVSDEWNGVTVDRLGNVRPLMPRRYTSLSQAEEENGQSRIYLGIHWSFDKTQGIAQGRRVADYTFDHAFGNQR